MMPRIILMWESNMSTLNYASEIPGTFLPLRGRANVSKMLLWVCFAASLLGLPAGMVEIWLLGIQSDGTALTSGQEFLGLATAGLALAHFGVYIASAVCFLVWMYRAAWNARTMSNGWSGKPISPGWAVGWWFIPIANLFKPYQVMKDIWFRGESPDGRDYLPTAGTPLLGWWWGMWIIGNILGNISSRLTWRAETYEEMQVAVGVGLVEAIPTLVAAVLAVRVVTAVTARLERRAAHMADSATPTMA